MPSAIFLHQHLPIWTSSLAWIAFALLSWTANAIVIYSGMNQMPAKVVKGIHLIVQICKCILIDGWQWGATMVFRWVCHGRASAISPQAEQQQQQGHPRCTSVSLFKAHTIHLLLQYKSSAIYLRGPLSLYYCHACPAFSTCCSISLRPTALLQARCLKEFNTNQTYYLLLH